tara:strand:- start:591 stop:812 length:222 start_codon:yes stop_codon:yes gene_type:complete
MEYIIQYKEKRPAGDWLITAESEEQGFYHGTFDYEPTSTQVDEKARTAFAEQIKYKERNAAEAARIAEEEVQE